MVDLAKILDGYTPAGPYRAYQAADEAMRLIEAAEEAERQAQVMTLARGLWAKHLRAHPMVEQVAVEVADVVYEGRPGTQSACTVYLKAPNPPDGSPELEALVELAIPPLLPGQHYMQDAQPLADGRGIVVKTWPAAAAVAA